MVRCLAPAIVDRVAEAVAAWLANTVAEAAPEWLDSRTAAEYLGLHRDTLHKLAAERAIPAEQDRPGCKLFFLRTDPDECRRPAAEPRTSHHPSRRGRHG